MITKRGSALAFYNSVRNIKVYPSNCIVWPFAKNQNGYAVFGRKQGTVKSCLVSRVMCSEVNGLPVGKRNEAAHTCGNGAGACINPSHLKWKTSKENSEDTISHGKANRGQRNGKAKLTNEQVREIKSALGLVTQAELARKYDVDGSVISNIKRGKHWGSVF